MKRLIFQVYVGARSNLYDVCTASVVDYAMSIGAEYKVLLEPILRIVPDPETSGRSDGASRLGYLPIFEKENSLAELQHYDQVAVIDADVWIRPGSPNIFETVHRHTDFAAVVEREMPLTAKYLRKIRRYSNEMFGSLDDVDWRWDKDGAEFWNCGVIVMNKSLLERLDGQTPREFLARPEFKRFVDGLGKWRYSTDQVLLCWWLRKERVNVQNLSWLWNGLYAAIKPGMAEQARFVHFFLRDHLPDKGENIEELIKEL